MNITKDENDLIIRVPLKANRSNLYDREFHDEMNNIVGVIAGNDCGFCNYIDMDYKGKPDQHTDFFYKYFGSDDKFRELCKTLEIDLIEYPVCSKCYKPMFGCFTVDKEGKDICFDCEEN